MSKQVSIARLRELGITPNRDLGQNFLIDDNVLRMIGSVAPLRDDDVVLEVGPGLGVLTRWLAERTRLVHAIEIDRRLQPALAITLDGVDNVRLLFADAMRIDFAVAGAAARGDGRQPALQRGDAGDHGCPAGV